MTQALVSIIVPVYNEAELIAGVLSCLASFLPSVTSEYEIIVCDNGSTDATASIVNQYMQQNPRVRSVYYPAPNYGRAIQQGFAAARGEYLVILNADWCDTDFIARSLSMLQDGEDLVLGSKNHAASNGYRYDHRPFLRRIITKFYNALVRRWFGIPFSDTHGLKAAKRTQMSSVVASIGANRELFDTELVIRCYRLGLRITEIPVEAREVRPARLSVARRSVRFAKDWWLLRRM